MPRYTLVLRQVPDALYRRLKAVAAAHRRSMNQEAILALEAGLPGEPMAPRPTVEQSRLWLEQQVWTLPVLDDRSAEDILGYGRCGGTHAHGDPAEAFLTVAWDGELAGAMPAA